ncbi:MAG: cell division protein FtsX [Candidatus Zixiibacteriota bacterium]
MSRISHILKELGRNLFNHPGTALGSLLALTLLFFLFELYWIAAGTAGQFYTKLLSDLRMEVYLGEEVSDSTLPAMQTSIADIEGVQSVEYVSKDQAREELRRLVGVDLLAGYDTINPLPHSFLLSFSPPYLNTTDMADIEDHVMKLTGVVQVAYSKRWLEKAQSVRALILKIGVLLGGVILLAVWLSLVNSIRLMTRARAVGFHQMRLLGAGRLFLAAPFLIEGLLIGGISAGAGWLLIFYAKRQVVFTQLEIVTPSLAEISVFCGVAAFLGLVSGYLGIHRLLR